MEDEIKYWLIEWFGDHTDLEKDKIKRNVSENYFERGWIDSFKFILFMTDIEKKFNIRFSNEEFQDRSFSTVEGLSKIIRRKINEK